MNTRLAILCPGQGGQHPAMFDLARTDPRTSTLLDHWLSRAQLGVSVEEILSSNDLLFSNRFAQPMIVAATMATWEAIRHDIPAPALVAGYSIGEVAAHGVAGTFAAVDAVRLAAARARRMDACIRTKPAQAMVAVSGLPLRPAAPLLQQCGFHPAIETGEESFLAGGPACALTEFHHLIAASGGQVTLLPVAVASHTPLMIAAVAPFAEELRRYALADPVIPVLSGITAETIFQVDRVISHLSRQIAEPIRWADCMDACAEAGVSVALELGPGDALSRMLHTRHPRIECRAVANFRSLHGVKTWLARQFD